MKININFLTKPNNLLESRLLNFIPEVGSDVVFDGKTWIVERILYQADENLVIVELI